MTTRYIPTYEPRADLAPADAAWLAREQGSGSDALIDVTDVCASLGVAATVRDEHGRTLGRVDAAGAFHPAGT